MPDIAVILAGCGHLDGAEIRESVLTLLALDSRGATAHCFAPDVTQHHVVNHLTGEESSGETRNVLIEASRIARGDIRPLSELDAGDFSGLILPGGYGVAKNCSDLAFKGADATVLPAYADAIRAFLDAGKPVGAICIAPAVLVAAVGAERRPTVTIGEDAGTAGVIERFGGTHQVCATSDITVDTAHRIVSTSAYMRDDRLSRVAEGIDTLVAQVLAFAGEA